jgi:U2-associated protein SR140
MLKTLLQVADIIISSILIDTTSVPRKVARLHLICDILHNSAASVPNAWKFRQEFETRMGIVFDHLSNIYHSFPGRITAQTFKTQITAVVDSWEDSIVFPPDFTTDLRRRLDGASAEALAEEVVPDQEDEPEVAAVSRFKTSFKPADAAKHSDEESMEMEVENDDAQTSNDIDVDGEPLDDVDGIPIDDDVDGIPMGDDDIDGEALEGDVDGEPLE